MKVSILPLDIVEADPGRNIEAVKNFTRRLDPDVDILLLPELFSTGFVKDEELFRNLAEGLDGPTMTALKQLARNKNLAIAGSFASIDDDGLLYNRAFFINPDDGCNITHYDKRHLFIISPEHRIFSPGKKLVPVIAFREWNIALCICFDIRFPVWCRNTDNRYDMMLVPANWPDSRYRAWKHLLMARAIENIAAYVGCNRSGSDLFGTYSFISSFGVDHRGTIVSEIHGNSPIRNACFDLEQLREFRIKFPVFEAADKFNITDVV